VPFERIALSGFKPRSPMAEALRRELPARVRIVEPASQSEVQVVADEDVLHRTVVASTAAGQVREFRLRVRLRFHFANPAGEALGSVTELEQMRDLSYSETAALGKEAEEAELLREMRADIARQVVQRLAAQARR
jgi:LPS-assembly lipoprotein